MTKNEMRRLARYFQDEARIHHGSVAMAATGFTLSAIGNVLLQFANAPDNLPPDDAKAS